MAQNFRNAEGQNFRNLHLEEVPMKLNESITTYDVAEALQGETGKFESNQPQRRALFRYVPARTLYCQLGVGRF